MWHIGLPSVFERPAALDDHLADAPNKLPVRIGKQETPALSIETRLAAARMPAPAAVTMGMSLWPVAACASKVNRSKKHSPVAGANGSASGGSRPCRLGLS